MTRKSFMTNLHEPVSFDVDGEEFTAKGAMPSRPLLAMAAMSGDTTKTQQMVEGFLERALLPESWARFTARMDSQETPITQPVLFEVFGYLMEHYAGGPTEVPSGSPDGPIETGASSTAPALSAASTP